MKRIGAILTWPWCGRLVATRGTSATSRPKICSSAAETTLSLRNQTQSGSSMPILNSRLTNIVNHAEFNTGDLICVSYDKIMNIFQASCAFLRRDQRHQILPQSTYFELSWSSNRSYFRFKTTQKTLSKSYSFDLRLQSTKNHNQCQTSWNTEDTTSLSVDWPQLITSNSIALITFSNVDKFAYFTAWPIRPLNNTACLHIFEVIPWTE